MAHYYLTAANEDYAPFFNKIREKSYLSKVVIEALFDARDKQESLDYEDLLATIEMAEVPKDMSPLSNESLINNASFIHDQVMSYELAGDDDEEKFMADAPCIIALFELAGVEKKKASKGKD